MKTYRKGQKFIKQGYGRDLDLYVLALVGVEMGKPYPEGDAIMKLICLRTGDRWSKGVTVENCIAVTQEEMNKLFSSGTFTPVEVEKVKVVATVTTTKTTIVKL